MQDAQEFKKYNQDYPDNFSQLEKDVISRFRSAKDQWFSSFLLKVGGSSSWHRLFVDPLSRAMYSSNGQDFEFIQAQRRQGMPVHDAVYALALANYGDEMAWLSQWIARHGNGRCVA
ncbi:hypothetical protein SGGMMB4_05798 (plasmid) [Sodalis glossinidius str. 'morsitans']|uniref:Uncharacterized protein n=1 Tax=Sodalis glossinidius (strain morsitans) TaxID=343509 RepID=A0A193QNN5_SODGM|nr:hypothetical protein SGGMMB4_05798 [Sodalis glossinidius str. 'morsitans']